MTKKTTFLDTPQWASIVENVKGIMISDSTMATLLDFERCLDESDVYAYRNWKHGELVDGPNVKKYVVQCTFMWPAKLMPDPRAGKRLMSLGARIHFKKTKIKVPIKVESADDYEQGTHFPKLIDQSIWLVRITLPKSLMNDIREGSVDIADQTFDLEDIDEAYEKDYDKADTKTQDNEQEQQGMGMGMNGLGGLPPLPGGPGGLPQPPGGLGL